MKTNNLNPRSAKALAWVVLLCDEGLDIQPRLSPPEDFEYVAERLAHRYMHEDSRNLDARALSRRLPRDLKEIVAALPTAEDEQENVTVGGVKLEKVTVCGE